MREVPERKDEVRDAATVILVRHDGAAPRVLMGQRGATAVFMPDRFVFPGGAVDPCDLELGARGTSPAPEPATLRHASREVAAALPFAAIRELWEETGLALGTRRGARSRREIWPEPWRGFVDAGVEPATAALRFVFRAVTPAGRPRRFDARFFLADAAALAGSPDDFARASGELRHLRWVDLAEARRLPLPFITEVVLSEVETRLAGGPTSRGVPFFRQGGDGSEFVLL